METKEILGELRKKNNLTQDEMAQRLFVTRQAVSRWETGETIPGTETLKLISKEFGLSINALLGQPEGLYCQSCGMPLVEKNLISHEHDGSLNEKYCKWCYADGNFLADCTMNEMIESCVPHMTGWNPDDARRFMRENFPKLERWRK
jgi:transcriptional regulator with XRE-family HTH domain